MPNLIVGLAMVIFLSTNAFAMLEGTGKCRGAYLAIMYLYNESPDCNDVDLEGYPTLCENAVDSFWYYTSTERQQLIADCEAFAEEYINTTGNLYDLCDCAGMTGGDEWANCQLSFDVCQYAIQKPYHIRFEPNPNDADNYAWDVEEQMAGTSTGKLKCYNDNDDIDGEVYVVKCNCGGYGNDLSGKYSTCDVNLVSTGGATTNCVLGTSGTTTYLCLSEMEIDMNECGACECYNSSGTWSNSGSGLLSRRKLAFKEMDFASGYSIEYGCELASNTEEYACDTGYYRISHRVCDVCPSHSSGEQTSSYANTTGGISACYVPAGSYSDTTGVYTFTQNCEYQN